MEFTYKMCIRDRKYPTRIMTLSLKTGGDPEEEPQEERRYPDDYLEGAAVDIHQETRRNTLSFISFRKVNPFDLKLNKTIINC